MEITSVEKSKANKDMLAIFIDNAYAFSIREDDYLSMNLYEKSHLTQDEMDYILRVVNKRGAKDIALKHLALKFSTTMEIYSKLINKGFDSELVTTIIEELVTMGYLNDKVYAEKFIRDRIKLKPKSKNMLYYELKQKGIEEDIINDVLENVVLDDKSIIFDLLEKRFANLNINDSKMRNKAYRFLMQRGFTLEDIKFAISQKYSGR